jgi:bifunctional isochorismate lyase/aryl carrier protein
LTIEWLRASLLPRVEEGGFGPDDNLIDYGLDSLEVMGLVAEWEKLGLRVSFEELAGTPTLNAWWDVLQRKIAA